MQRTCTCPCSVRALEAFVRDFARLEMRQTRPNRVTTRHLSTRPALAIRHSISQHAVTHAHSASRNLDDTFVPFDLRPENTDVAKHASVQESQVSFPTDAPLESEAHEGLDDLEDFEPEVVIHQHDHDPLQALQAADQPLLPEDGALQNIDAVALPRLQLPQLSLDDKPYAGRLNIILPEKSREERRKERKIRRQEEKKREKEELRAQKAAALAVQKKQEREERRNPPRVMAGKTSVAVEAAASYLATNPALKKKDSPIKPTSKKNEESIKPTSRKTETSTFQPPIYPKPEKEQWQTQKAALESKFGTQTWNPRKRISPDALSGIRALHAKQPETYSTPVLAEHFKVPPEAIRRILKSKWQPNEGESEERRKRWEKRGERKWNEMAEQGIRPPKKWRDMGVGKAAKGEVPKWKAKGTPGERWIPQADADGFVMAGHVADEEDNVHDSIAERIL